MKQTLISYAKSIGLVLLMVFVAKQLGYNQRDTMILVLVGYGAHIKASVDKIARNMLD